MKKSSRARRMARHHGKHKAVATLNLTSLMDIFTSGCLNRAKTVLICLTCCPQGDTTGASEQ